MKSKVIKQTTKVKKAFFEYETNKIVQINSKKIGVLLRFFQLLMLVYIIGYVMIYMHGYQDSHGLSGSVVVKVKGIGHSNKSDSHRKIWDISDIVIPPQENNAVFITTNTIETLNQTQTTCPEDPNVPGAQCQKDSDCLKDKAILLGNGVMTGRCVEVKDKIKTCEIYAWCPLENDTIINSDKSLLSEIPSFTILVRNTIMFDELNVKRSNLFAWENRLIPKSCTYDPDHYLLKYCPIFKISSLLGKLTFSEMKELLTYGGIIQVIINWDCDLDFSENQCKPEYSFNRLDPRDGKLSKGWNFRYSSYYINHGREFRYLYKAFGLRILFEVRGKARKFSGITLTMNIGSGLALLGVATIICDFIIIFLLPNREKYFQSKYELHNDDDAYQDTDEDATSEKTDYGSITNK